MEFPCLVGGRMIRIRLIGVLAISILGVGSVASVPASAQSKPASKAYEQLIYSVKGPELFHAHCAACHGAEGKGDGPVGAALKAKPANLTVLAKNNGGKFPVERVQKFIVGEDSSLASHGTREMPVWGPIFHQVEEDQDFGNVRIHNLIQYLESIQQK